MHPRIELAKAYSARVVAVESNPDMFQGGIAASEAEVFLHHLHECSLVDEMRPAIVEELSKQGRQRNVALRDELDDRLPGALGVIAFECPIRGVNDPRIAVQSESCQKELHLQGRVFPSCVWACGVA